MMKKIALAYVAIFAVVTAHADDATLNSGKHVNARPATAIGGTHEMIAGEAIIVDSSATYSFPRTNIRALLVNRDLYAMLDKYSGTKGAYVACAEISDANAYAAKPMFFTDFFGITHAPSAIEEWRRNVATDAVSKQATYVGFDCKVGSTAELASITQKATLEKKERAFAAYRQEQNVQALKKLEPLFGRYSNTTYPQTDDDRDKNVVLEISGSGNELSLQLNTSCCAMPLTAKIPAGQIFTATDGDDFRVEVEIEELGHTIRVHIMPSNHPSNPQEANVLLSK